ncbi:hypothetical protein RBSH_01547 [Rhodopirellula baltica SH28]|uniref:Uncharacterized protein n=1 Tax=Rhodopirellula baltica SH28 TaxID=993517 RepID=K5D936_RHOBT|nr:hypothetical protein RBSH_01547 [Rhodopirellula baltica SH28]
MHSANPSHCMCWADENVFSTRRCVRRQPWLVSADDNFAIGI